MAPDAAPILTFAPSPHAGEPSVDRLTSPVRAWFSHHYCAATPAQCHAWPAIAADKHLLLSAPTGSGKTLAAFLPILGEILANPHAGLGCLYVAPLKALGTDVRRTLRRCLSSMSAMALASDHAVRIGIRTGDTRACVRQQMLQNPPNILLTTPESLAVLLTQAKWVANFTSLQWIVVDEVHSFAGNKRGADLSLTLERLEDIAAAPPQRIGLSATCAPLGVAARWLVGNDRTCTIARVSDAAPAQLEVEPLEQALEVYPGFLGRLVERLVPELERNRTTLIFTNARGLAERLTWALRRRFPDWDDDIAIHHSSLAAARRRQVERRLKQGRLRVVVSSTSLELGIDIGSVDLVVLVHPPGSVVRLLQRLGRSGHGPGKIRRGLVLTANAGELLEAAVTCTSSQDAQVETLAVPDRPLDVLCQHLLGMATARPWHPDEAFALVRRAFAYWDLPREEFDECLAYLFGRDHHDREWLPPRLAWNDGHFQIVDRRTMRLVRCNLGTIVADEPREVRSLEGVLIGHIDEPFADHLQPGDRFLLDGRCLEFRSQGTSGLEVQEVPGRPMVPRWQSDGLPVSLDLAQRIYIMRQRACEALRDGIGALTRLLRHEYHLNSAAALQLADFFVEQESRSEIPTAGSVLVEVIQSGTMTEHYLHTPLPRSANDALARVAVRRLATYLDRSCTSLVADLGLLLCVEGPPLQPDQVRQLFRAEEFDTDLQRALADSISLRQRFSRVALTALMVLRNPLGRRRKVGGADWPAQRLFEHIRAEQPDFVLLRQAAREVRAEVCHLEPARAWAESLPNMPLRIRVLGAPSPFARGWSQAISGPGQSAQTPEEALRQLHAELMNPSRSA
jgi:ATP-dependent Lhr-like helicase